MSTIPSPPDSGFHPASFQKNTDGEPSWNEGFSAGWKAAKEGPPGYRERLSAADTVKVVWLAKNMHDAVLAVSTGQEVDDATLIGALTIALGSLLVGGLCPTHRDEWVQQFTAGLPAFVAMCSEDGPNALRHEKGDYGHLRLVKRPELQRAEIEGQVEEVLK